MEIRKRSLLLVLGFLLFVIGMLSLILSMVGVSLSFMLPIDNLGILWATSIKVSMVVFGLVLFYILITNR